MRSRCCWWLNLRIASCCTDGAKAVAAEYDSHSESGDRGIERLWYFELAIVILRHEQINDDSVLIEWMGVEKLVSPWFDRLIENRGGHTPEVRPRVLGFGVFLWDIELCALADGLEWPIRLKASRHFESGLYLLRSHFFHRDSRDKCAYNAEVIERWAELWYAA